MKSQMDRQEDRQKDREGDRQDDRHFSTYSCSFLQCFKVPHILVSIVLLNTLSLLNVYCHCSLVCVCRCHVFVF